MRVCERETMEVVPRGGAFEAVLQESVGKVEQTGMRAASSGICESS